MKAKPRRRNRRKQKQQPVEETYASVRADLEDKAAAYNLWTEKIKARVRMERMRGIDTYTYDYATEYAKEVGKAQDKADACNFWLKRRMERLSGRLRKEVLLRKSLAFIEEEMKLGTKGLLSVEGKWIVDEEEVLARAKAQNSF